jgi:hypothetical protein
LQSISPVDSPVEIRPGESPKIKADAPEMARPLFYICSSRIGPRAIATSPLAFTFESTRDPALTFLNEYGRRDASRTDAQTSRAADDSFDSLCVNRRDIELRRLLHRIAGSLG